MDRVRNTYYIKKQIRIDIDMIEIIQVKGKVVWTRPKNIEG